MMKLNFRFTRLVRQAGVLGAALSAGIVFELATGMSAAYAADALNGKSLYLNGPVSGGTSCTACHGASPANNVNGILRGANNPTEISNAWAQNKGGMGTLYNNKFSQAEIADLAAFIGNPGVVAGPIATVSPASLVFNGTTIGQTSTALSTTVSNTGSAALNLTAIALTGGTSGDFSLAGGSCAAGAALAPSATCTVLATFKPTAQGTRTTSISISHNATGGSSLVSLSGTGNAAAQAGVAVSATSLNFGSVLVNAASAAQTITISNSGQAALNFSSIGLTGANASIFALGGSCSTQTAVAAGGQCTVTVQATPAAAGAFAAALNIASNASNGSVVISLTGSGAAATPAITATPSVLAFGAQTVGGNPVTQQISLSNTGNVVLTLSSVKVSGSSAIVIGAGNTCGSSLAVGASCNVPVVFTPATEGDASASLAVTSNAAALQVAVTGTATSKAVAKPVLSDTSTVQFTDTQVGVSSAKHTTTLSNTGTAALKITSLVLNGSQLNDFALAGTCAVNGTVSPAASCTIDTTFKPSSAGSKIADVLVVTDGGTQLSVHLAGTGIAIPVKTVTLNINPQSFDFGSATIGSANLIKRFTLSNPSTSAIALTNAAFTGPYAAVVDSASCPRFPFSLQANTSCDLVVSYAPANAGTNNGSVVISSSDTTATWSISLAGTAVATTVPVVTGNAPRSEGGGGCSVARDGNDPMLPILVMLAAAVILWRRRQARQDATQR
ncbi:choice-of-anchor D domain-containing protein [Undibacterium sp. Di26W]|uniref:choice-of-anchor D domain-containing protein n=1 Tax=Undibacterium sp. Di26W TaxID=3413035 RepID=UPI003BF11717